ncbi:MAG: hypothetical protein RBR59_02625 [Sulfurimonadaceae bacterium]|jgi:hypothetical protein|nr:hypothetical protein [Sulfurimonadaceae bacterium]
MRHEILARYELSQNNEIIIDIAIDKIEELYSNFDRKSPFLKKDLSEDFVNYLIECVQEIGDKNFFIRLDLETPPAVDSLSRIKNSIHNFFYYLIELKSIQMRAKAKTSFILLIVGLFLASVAIVLHSRADAMELLFLGVIAEGLSVAAWVALWESLATFLIHFIPFKKRIKLYERIAHAEITIRTEKQK